MADNSSVAGYLAPAAPPPDYDAVLEDIFQALCVGIVGLPGNMVRPRWQINPAGMPGQEENWAAYGLTVGSRQWDAYQSHDPNANGGLGTSTVHGTEVLHVNYSFYGPARQMNASIFRDGMSITQNRDVLDTKKIKFVEFLEPVTLPFLLKDVWNQRMDLKGVFQRTVSRTYAIQNIASASGTINNESYVSPFSVPNP